MKQFETFGEYMFDLLFAPLKKGRKTVNQLRIFFKVMGREFDDLKAAIFRVRSEANVASCSEVMLPVHGQDRDMPRLEGEDAEAYRTRLSMKGIISQWSGTRRGVLYALTALGYDRSRIELFADQDAERWAEFIIFLNSSKPSGVTNLSVIDGQVRKVKEGSSTGDSRYISPYKRKFSQKIAYRLNYADMKNVLTCLTSISHLLTDGLRSKASR